MRRAAWRAAARARRHVGLVAMCAVALACGLRAVAGLTYPGDTDFYRDMGASQSFLDGMWAADPAYLGEWRWYNPLVPFGVAVLSWLTHVPLHQLYATGGACLNLLAPVGFYAMVCALFDRRVAAAATAGYLFLGCLDQMSWMGATYSPWIWPISLAQVCFYVAVLAHVRALRLGTAASHVLSGVALGLMLLSENFGALILAAWVVLEGVSRGRLRGVLVTGATSFVVALPHLIPMVGHYHAKVVNWAPGAWLAYGLTYDLLGDVPRRFFFNGRTLLALVGVVLLVRQRLARDAVATRLLGTWLGVSVGYFVYTCVALVAAQRAIRLPSPVPSWHALYWCKGAESVLFGVAMARLLPRLKRRRLWMPLALGAWVLLRLPAYVNSQDMMSMRRLALEVERSCTPGLYTWALDHLTPRDVVLNPLSEMSSMALIAADRRVVQAPDIFSNPYVPLEPRLEAAGRMYLAIDHRDAAAFAAVAARYSVTHALLPRAQRAEVEARPVPWLRRVHDATCADDEALDAYELTPLR